MRSADPKMARQSFPLSATDAFFVAYQERCSIQMQLGCELRFPEAIDPESISAMLRYLVARWPQLEMGLQRRGAWLAWKRRLALNEMLLQSDMETHVWWNRPLDPFLEPAFQVLSRRQEKGHVLAFRAHHALMDGEAFYLVCASALAFLTRWPDDGWPRPREKTNSQAQTKQHRTKTKNRQGNLLEMWRFLRAMGKEARARRYAVLVKHHELPAPTATISHELKPQDWSRLRRRAREQRAGLPWLFSAAWMRAILAHNRDRGAGQRSLISLEAPVSLRRERGAGSALGNHISSLVVFGDGDQPLIPLALDLKQQFSTRIRQRAHLAMPRFSAPARFLPWPLFRGLAVNSATTTGFATSHFTWLSLPRLSPELRTRVPTPQSLAQFNPILLTPVCLHMGAALAVLPLGDRARIFLTYREGALERPEADWLCTRLTAELGLHNRLGAELQS